MNVEDCRIIICMNICVCMYMHVEICVYDCMYVRTYTRDVNSWIAIAKKKKKNKKTLFTNKLDLNFRKKLVKFSCVWIRALYGAET
jgi:hypothetical protein